jgi:hypothetical protein
LGRFSPSDVTTKFLRVVFEPLFMLVALAQTGQSLEDDA